MPIRKREGQGWPNISHAMAKIKGQIMGLRYSMMLDSRPGGFGAGL